MREYVGPYRILDVLGRGGMGIVYRGIHDHLDRKVAIKALAPELTRDAQFRDRFFSEARTQAQLQHPNIVTIYDLLEDGGEYFIVMEFVAGQGLDEILAERPGSGLGEGEALALFSQILSALDSAHSQGVIHRDVKASNVLVGKGGQVKLMDFGIALLIGDKRLTQSSQTIGTPVYMSPEQILRPREVDHRTDIYSAAILLYELLAGRPPFDAETEYEIKKQHIEAVPPDITGIDPQLTPGLSAVISRALSKNPDERFPSAGEFLRTLGTVAPRAFAAADTWPAAMPPVSNLSPVPPPSTASPAVTGPPSPLPATRKTRWLLAAAVVGLVVIAVLAAAALMIRFLTPTPDDGAAPTASSSAQPPAPPPAVIPPRSAGPAASSLPPASRRQSQPFDQASRRERDSGFPTEKVDKKAEKKVEPAPPKAVKQSPPRPQKNVEAEIRKKTIAEIRKKIQTGIAQAEGHIAQGELEVAQNQVKELIGLSSRYQSELVDEVVTLRLLEDRITNAIVAERMRENEEATQRVAWERRIAEIQGLVDGKSYPEAKKLAQNLLAEEGVPEDIAQQAQDLMETADQELKKLFANTQWEDGTDEVKLETKRDKKRRKKEKEQGDGTPNPKGESNEKVHSIHADRVVTLPRFCDCR